MQITPKEERGYCLRHGIYFKDEDFIQKLKEIGQPLDKTLSPCEAIDGWAGLIEEIEDGYNWIPAELDNDLDLSRADMDLILKCRELNGYEEYEKFVTIIERLDERFRQLSAEYASFPDNLPWYRRRVLKKAGPAYVNFFDDQTKKKTGIQEI